MTKSYSLEEIAKLTETELHGEAGVMISGAADLHSAQPEEISFCDHLSHAKALKHSSAGAFFVPPQFERPAERNCLVGFNPELAFQKMLGLFQPYQDSTGFTGIHSTAIVHKTAQIGSEAVIGPYAVIDKDAVIGDRTTVLSGCYVGLGTHIGSDCLIHPHAVILKGCKLGNRIIIQPGAVIGACGYGYTQDRKGQHIKLSHLGTVQIDDDVEIGANTCIDRARFTATHIQRGTKIDNLVQIAHNVVIGEDNIIVGQAGFAGSAKTGNHVMIGGQTGIAGHLTIASKTMIAARSGVSKSLKSGKYGGVPALPIDKYNRIQVLLRNIETYVDRIKEIQQDLKELRLG